MMGALKVRHGHMRAFCLARNLLVVDEVHASDTYMRAIIQDLLDAHLGAGGYALLMSATLGSAARRSLLSRGRRRMSGDPPTPGEAEAVPYPAIVTGSPSGEVVTGVAGSAGGKSVTVNASPAMRDFADVARRALAAARNGAKVLVIRNTVGFAIETQRALLEEAATDGNRALLFACHGFPTLHHGRFAAEDRKLLDAAVEEQVGRGRPRGGRHPDLGAVVGHRRRPAHHRPLPGGRAAPARRASPPPPPRGTPRRFRDRDLRGADSGG